MGIISNIFKKKEKVGNLETYEEEPKQKTLSMDTLVEDKSDSVPNVKIAKKQMPKKSISEFIGQIGKTGKGISKQVSGGFSEFSKQFQGIKSGLDKNLNFGQIDNLSNKSKSNDPFNNMGMVNSMSYNPFGNNAPKKRTFHKKRESGDTLAKLKRQHQILSLRNKIKKAGGNVSRTHIKRPISNKQYDPFFNI